MLSTYSSHSGPAPPAHILNWDASERLMQFLDRVKMNVTTATGGGAYLFLPLSSHYVAEKEANKMDKHQSLQRASANYSFITFMLR